MKNILLFSFLLILLNTPNRSNAQACGTEPTVEQINYLDQTREQRQNYDPRALANVRNGSNYLWVPVQIHDGRMSDGSNGEYEGNFGNLISGLNTIFQPEGVQFYECSFIHNIDDDVLYYFDISEEGLLSTYDVPNVINMYFFGNVTNGSGNYCGYSYLPPSTDKIVMSKNVSCFNSNVLAHEVGHYLSLYHTHGKSNNTQTDELVDGSNCTIAGDDICDTPADPNLLYQSNSNCQYTGTSLDLNGQPYNPDVNNRMSYAPQSCRSDYSTGQINRMLYSLANDRNYLNGCTHPSSCDNPIVSFPYNQDFENGLDGWRIMESNYWTMIYFQINAGPTPTSGTGPSSAASGNNYAYGEPDDGTEPELNMGLISPCIDISNLTSPQFSFQYHMYGTPYGLLGVQVSTDGGYNWAENPLLFYIDGDQGNQWNTALVDLTPYKMNDLVQVRILGITADMDIAIDNIIIEDSTPTTCSLTLTTYQSDVICNGHNNGTASVDIVGPYTLPVTTTWSNGGIYPAVYNLSPGSYHVTVIDAQNCSAIQSFVINEPQSIICQSTSTDATAGNNDGSVSVFASGGISPFNYYWSNGATTSVVNNLSAGTYSVTITDANGCQESCSVIVNESVVCSDSYNGFPYSHSFESGYGRFEQETSLDDNNWRRRSGSTPTNNTGPSGAFDGNKYAYVESSGSNNNPGKVSILKVKKCLNLTNVTNPVFEFSYHMYGSTMGSLEVEVSLDDEASWTSLWSQNGNNGNQWFSASINLTAYQTDHTKLRIKGTTGPGGNSDIAIDGYYIGSAGGNNDIVPSDGSIRENSLLLFPNPSNGLLHIDTNIDLKDADVVVYDKLGQSILTTKIIGSILDLSQVANGHYFIKINTTTDVITKQIIIIQ